MSETKLIPENGYETPFTVYFEGKNYPVTLTGNKMFRVELDDETVVSRKSYEEVYDFLTSRADRRAKVKGERKIVPAQVSGPTEDNPNKFEDYEILGHSVDGNMIRTKGRGSKRHLSGYSPVYRRFTREDYVDLERRVSEMNRTRAEYNLFLEARELGRGKAVAEAVDNGTLDQLVAARFPETVKVTA